MYKTPPQVTGFLYWSLIQDIPSHKFSLLESYTIPKVESYFGHFMHIPRCNKHWILFSSHGIALLESYTSYPQVTGILYWSLIQTPNPGVLYTGVVLRFHNKSMSSADSGADRDVTEIADSERDRGR